MATFARVPCHSEPRRRAPRKESPRGRGEVHLEARLEDLVQGASRVADVLFAKSMRAGPIAISLAGVCALFTARSASAYERQQHFGLEAGGALSQTDSAKTRAGIDLGLHYTYGISDAFNFVAEVGGAGLTAQGPSKAPPPQPGIVATGGAGVTYVFDVVRWVPYAGVLLGPAYFAGARVAHPFWTPDAQLAVGLDYEITRSWAVGFAYRQHMFVSKMSTYPEFTTLGLRVEYIWGW